jgi:uncharacterized protein
MVDTPTAIVPPALGLSIGQTLTLPVKVITRTMAILGVKGAGKTHAAVVVAEEAIQAHVPVLVIDPLGAWYGHRSSRDGTEPGLPVVVFGGRHGDLPLEPGMGTALADLLVEEPISAILDLTLLRRAHQVTLLAAFCRHLFDRTIERSETHPQPRLLIVDEADLFAPQRQLRRSADHQALHEALEDIVRRARKGGLGSLLSQRNAALDKDLLSQAEVLFMLRLVEPNDVDAVDEWVRRRVSSEQRTELLSSLSALAKGEAWVALAGEASVEGDSLPLVRRVRIRARMTFDSSRTPTLGVTSPLVPRTWSVIDLAHLQERLAATSTSGDRDRDAQDPASPHLLARLAELERRLRERPERIEVPVLPPETAQAFAAAMDRLEEVASSLIATSQALRADLARGGGGARACTERAYERGGGPDDVHRGGAFHLSTSCATPRSAAPAAPSGPAPPSRIRGPPAGFTPARCSAPAAAAHSGRPGGAGRCGEAHADP